MRLNTQAGNIMKTKHKSGFSLIEIMVAALVLAALAVGGAAALYHAGAGIQEQELKRMAVDQAMERLELVKRTKYSIIRPAANGVPRYYIDQDQDDLVESGELQNTQGSETQKRFPMVTTLTLAPPPSATESEFLQVGVAVTYDIAGQQVVMDAIIVP